MLKTWLTRALVLGWIPTLFVAGGARWLDEPAASAQERTPIKVSRIYTGEDGQTHVEELDVPLTLVARRHRAVRPGPGEQRPVPADVVRLLHRLAHRAAPAVRHHAGGGERGRVRRRDEGQAAPGPHPARRGHNRAGAHLACRRNRRPDLDLPAARGAVARRVGRSDVLDGFEAVPATRSNSTSN